MLSNFLFSTWNTDKLYLSETRKGYSKENVGNIVKQKCKESKNMTYNNINKIEYSCDGNK